MTLPGQMELDTVIDHTQKPISVKCYSDHHVDGYESAADWFGRISMNGSEDTHKPDGVRLAKMLSQYDDSPSSQLWSDIQRLAREILK